MAMARAYCRGNGAALRCSGSLVSSRRWQLPDLRAGARARRAFHPSSIMNAEAIRICKYLDLPGRSVWYPIIIATCSLAALGGAICFGITAALVMAPHPRVEVAPLALRQLARDVTVLSAGEFLLALLVGTLGVTLFMLSGGQEEPSHE
jgi:hypothetical protein